jgi:hypothetical protein
MEYCPHLSVLAHLLLSLLLDWEPLKEGLGFRACPVPDMSVVVQRNVYEGAVENVCVNDEGSGPGDHHAPSCPLRVLASWLSPLGSWAIEQFNDGPSPLLSAVLLRLLS